MTPSESPNFQTTRWTQVLAACGSSVDAQVALRDLCVLYHRPLETFIARYLKDSEAARDLTQEFVASLLAGNRLGGVDPGRGKFRTYLLGAVKHFLANQREKSLAQRRGGGELPVSLNELGTAGSDAILLADPQGFPPDAFFDHEWALALVEDAMQQMEQEAESKDRHTALQKWLIAAEGGDMLADAESLGMNENAFRVAVHRHRKRFRQIVKERIAATIDDPSEIQAELAYLITALTSQIAAD
ncbi:MAG: hypothetical protein U0894_08025 [Pirellulales bacterium]